MDTLQHILSKYNISYDGKTLFPIIISNFNRIDLARLTKELNFKVGVEIGVAMGHYSEQLCIANPEMQLYSVDPWTPYRAYRDYTRKIKIDGLYESAKARLAKYPNCKMVQKFSMDALKDFEDESVDFVYIDGNHRFEFVTNDIAEWMKKLKIGGIMSGHDYTNVKKPSNTQVFEAVNGYTHAYSISPWFTTGYVMEANKDKDGSRSWFWVKEKYAW